MSGDLAFNGFSKGLSESKVWAFRTILRIFCPSSSVYLAIERVDGLTRGSTGALSWLDSRKSEDLLKVRSLQGHSQPWIEVILILKRSGAG